MVSEFDTKTEIESEAEQDIEANIEEGREAEFEPEQEIETDNDSESEDEPQINQEDAQTEFLSDADSEQSNADNSEFEADPEHHSVDEGTEVDAEQETLLERDADLDAELEAALEETERELENREKDPRDMDVLEENQEKDFQKDETSPSEIDLHLLDEALESENESSEKANEKDSEKEVEVALAPTEDDLDLLDSLLDEDDDAPLDLLSLPEFDEKAVLDESDYQPEPSSYNEDSSFDLNDESLLNLEDFPEYTEEDAAAEPHIVWNEENEAPLFNGEKIIKEGDVLEKNEIPPSFSATQLSTLDFPAVETIGIDELGEFDENDAFDAALAEQRELDESASVHNQFQQKSPSVSEQYQSINLDDLADFDDEDEAYQVAGLNMNALLSDFSSDESLESPEFDLDEIDIPEDESNIWTAEKTAEPELESEDWSQQLDMTDESLEERTDQADLEGLLEEAKSELIDSVSMDDGFISIETLLKDDGIPQEDPDSLTLNLDVGLEDFPDVLNGVLPIDVDAQGEAAAYMDLAKAYLEMNDLDGAIELLEKVMQSDDLQLKEEARRMIENIN